MRVAIGKKETSSALIIYSLSPALLALVGINSNTLGTGALFNCIICFVLSVAAVMSLKYYYRICGNCDIVSSVCTYFGKYISVAIGVVFFLLIFLSVVFSYNLYCDQIRYLAFNDAQKDKISLLICVTSALCAYMSIEAMSRQSYVVLCFGYAIIAFLIYTTAKGWNPDNLYPIMGMSVKSTFTHYLFLSLYSGVAPLLIISGYLKSKDNAYSCAVKTVLVTFGLTLILVLLYVITVPHTMGNLFSNRLEAVFASASSGEVLHRFEIFLVSLFGLFSVISTSFALRVAAISLCKACGWNDSRPYVLIMAVVLYQTHTYKFSTWAYIVICLVFAAICLVVPLATGVYAHHKKQKGI